MARKRKSEDEQLEEEVAKLIAAIMIRAQEAAGQVDAERLAKQVLAEAHIIARWNRRPFYIS